MIDAAVGDRRKLLQSQPRHPRCLRGLGDAGGTEVLVPVPLDVEAGGDDRATVRAGARSAADHSAETTGRGHRAVAGDGRHRLRAAGVDAAVGRASGAETQGDDGHDDPRGELRHEELGQPAHVVPVLAVGWHLGVHCPSPSLVMMPASRRSFSVGTAIANAQSA